MPWLSSGGADDFGSASTALDVAYTALEGFRNGAAGDSYLSNSSDTNLTVGIFFSISLGRGSGGGDREIIDPGSSHGQDDGKRFHSAGRCTLRPWKCSETEPQATPYLSNSFRVLNLTSRNILFY